MLTECHCRLRRALALCLRCAHSQRTSTSAVHNEVRPGFLDARVFIALLILLGVCVHVCVLCLYHYCVICKLVCWISGCALKTSHASRAAHTHMHVHMCICAQVRASESLPQSRWILICKTRCHAKTIVLYVITDASRRPFRITPGPGWQYNDGNPGPSS